MPLLGRNTHENLDDLHMHPGGTTHTADRMLPLFRYAERAKCEGDGPCDAFTMLAATLEAVALGLKII